MATDPHHLPARPTRPTDTASHHGSQDGSPTAGERRDARDRAPGRTVHGQAVAIPLAAALTLISAGVAFAEPPRPRPLAPHGSASAAGATPKKRRGTRKPDDAGRGRPHRDAPPKAGSAPPASRDRGTREDQEKRKRKDGPENELRNEPKDKRRGKVTAEDARIINDLEFLMMLEMLKDYEILDDG